MKSICIVFAGLIISFAGSAQTKRIAQRSHSGSSENILVNSEDNYGLSPAIIAKEKQANEVHSKRDSAAAKAAKNSAEKAAVVKPKKAKGKVKHKG